MSDTLEFNDISLFFKRRKKIFFFTFIVVAVIGFSIAVALPPIFRSEAKILVEEQEIPTNYVPAQENEILEKRLGIINQQVLTRDNLLHIIDEFDLYREERQGLTKTEMLNKIRNSIFIETINAEVSSQRSGKKYGLAIAFSIAFEGSSPETTQRVTEKIANLFLDIEQKESENRVANTLNFLQAELKALQNEIRDHENKISQFKKIHTGELPENVNMNLQTLALLQRDLDRKNVEIRGLEEQKVILSGRLTTVDPLLPVKVDGKEIANPKDRLRALYMELFNLQSLYSDKHPDVITLKKEIAKLENQVGGLSDSLSLKLRRIEGLESQKSQLVDKYGPSHPDVVKIDRELQALKADVSRQSQRREPTFRQANTRAPENPVYINLQTQLESFDSKIASLTLEKRQIEAEIREYRKKIENAPLVEKEFSELTRNYETAKNKYDEFYKKYMEAKVQQGIEESKHGRHFSLKSAAYLPDKPYKPNRGAIIVISLLAALALGFGASTLRESMDHSIKSSEEIKQITGAQVLSVVSKVETAHDKRIKFAKNVVLVILLAGIITSALYLIDRYYIPLKNIYQNIQHIL